MRTEKIVLSFIAVVVGLLVAGVGFYFFTSSKMQPKTKNPTVASATPHPTDTSKLSLTITNPQSESVTTKSLTTISGSTSPDATVMINTGSTDSVVTPSSSGAFSSDISLDDGENQITITAIATSGEEIQKIIIITSSKETF